MWEIEKRNGGDRAYRDERKKREIISRRREQIMTRTREKTNRGSEVRSDR
jgi:hypothetical protein